MFVSHYSASVSIELLLGCATVSGHK